MGQSWWWVVLAVVVVVALLVVVARLRARRGRDSAAPANVASAVNIAAAGGVAGAVGAGAVAAAHAEEEGSASVDESALDQPDEPPADSDGSEAVAEEAGASDGSVATDAAPAADSPAPAEAGAGAESGDAAEQVGSVGSSADSGADTDSAGTPEPEASEPDSGAETGDSQPSALAADLPEPRAAGRLDNSSPEDDGPATAPAGAAASIPAPREEQSLSGSSGEPAERRTPAPRTPGPAGSALSAIDSGLVGPATSVAAAAAAVSDATSRPGPYPGSLLPAEDGSSPSPDHQVKANEGSRRFHTPDSPFYLRTRGDAWFRTADEARAAGFSAWDA